MKNILRILPALMLCGSARAMHPLISEDTGFLGKGGRQVEAGYEYSRASAGGDAFSRSLEAELSYGLTDRSDLLFTVPWIGRTGGGTAENGIGDMAVDLKFQLAEKTGWVLALKPGIILPSGDEAEGLGAGKAGAKFGAVAGKISGPWQWYLNAGYVRNANWSGEKEDILKGSAAAVYEVGPHTLLTADLMAETNADPGDRTTPLSSVLGIAWSPYGALDLDAGIKFGLTDPADDVALLAGATFRF